MKPSFCSGMHGLKEATEETSRSPETPAQNTKHFKSSNDPLLEWTEVTSKIEPNYLVIKDDGQYNSNNSTDENFNQLSSLIKGLQGIWPIEDIVSYVVSVSNSTETPDKKDTVHIGNQATQIDLQETSKEIGGRVLALIGSGRGQWEFRFEADSPIRTHASSGNGKQGIIPWVNRAQRAARAAVVLNNRNVKRDQEARDRQDERDRQKKDRIAKGDYVKGENKWLCHKCDDQGQDPAPQENFVQLCAECDHAHAECDPCHDPNRLANYFRLKRERRERST